MTRFLSTSMQAQSEQSLLQFRLLVKLGVTSGYVHFCNGRQFLYFDSSTYVPTGGLGEVSPIEEESDVFPRDVTMRLSGVNTLTANGSLSLYEPLREDMFNRDVYIYRAFIDPQAMTMPNTPELVWKGKVQAVQVKPEDGAYEVTASSEFRRGAKVQYFNRETFRAVDSSDTFGDHVDKIPLFKSEWGGAPTYFNGGPPNVPGRGRGIIYDSIRNRNYPTGG